MTEHERIEKKLDLLLEFMLNAVNVASQRGMMLRAEIEKKLKEIQ